MPKITDTVVAVPAVTTPIFTLAMVASAIEAMAKAQLSAANSIAKVIVMAAFAANHGFVNGAGKAEPTAAVANSLMKNLRKGVKKDAVVAVLEKMCNLAYISGTFQMYPAAGKDWGAESIKAIKVAAGSWESAKKAPDTDKTVDAVDEFEAVIEKLNKKIAKDEHSVTHAPMLARMQLLLAEIRGELVMEVTTD